MPRRQLQWVQSSTIQKSIHTKDIKRVLENVTSFSAKTMEMLENSFTAVIGLIVGGLIIAKYLMKKSISSIPIFTFPSDRSENFKMIQKDRLDPLFTSDSVTSDSVRSVPEPGGRKSRIYHSFNLQRKVKPCIGCVRRNSSKDLIIWWLVSIEYYPSYCSYWLRSYQQSFQKSCYFIPIKWSPKNDARVVNSRICIRVDRICE